MRFKQAEKRFRLEIEGLRAVAAMLVAIYHIWFNRVSGGVDVFFVVSGFLITTSLMSTYRKERTINPFSYIVKLLKRLMPTAWTIAIMTLIASLFIMPITIRADIVQNFVSSVLYFENWHLALNAVDYLADNASASPYQHFWALSIQFQFYVIWALLFFLAVQTEKKINTFRFVPILSALIFILVVSSFGYSIYLTEINQPFAYYHTFTRLWEFGVGGLLALGITRLQPKKWFANMIGWLGLIGLILCGMVLQVSTMFPGYAALWPVLCAVFIIVAGNQSLRVSAYEVLSTSVFVKFGKISYAFYLWHWPLLIFYYQIFNVEKVSITGGLAIITLATILAYLTITLIESPLRKVRTRTMPTAIVIGILVITVVSGYSVWDKQEQERLEALEQEMQQRLLAEQKKAEAQAKEEQRIKNEYNANMLKGQSLVNPGALVAFTDQAMEESDEFLIPSIEIAKRDESAVYADECITKITETEVVICEYGDTDQPSYTIALIGGSHSAHWQPMLDAYGKKNNVKIRTYLKPRCRTLFNSDEDGGNCAPWFDDAIAQLVADQPDLVFATADIGKQQEPTVPKGFVEVWEYLNKRDIPIFVVRDNVWFPFNVVDCVANNEADPTKCKVKRSDVIAEPSPFSLLKKVPENVTYMDVTDYYCDDNFCYPVVGNIITHFDSNHFTATFSRTFEPIIGEKLNETLQTLKDKTPTEEEKKTQEASMSKVEE